MAINQFLTTSELDFETLKESLKNSLKAQKAFEDYDFEGSNMSALLDILVYNTFLNGTYLNMVGSEMFLDTSILRESVVSNSKELNYVPRSRVSSIAPVTVSVFPDDSPNFITIPKYYKIYSTINNTTYTFTCNEAVVIQNVGGNYVSDVINFYEGEIVTEVFTATPTYDDEGNIDTYIYPLSSENIDTSSIEVTVQNSAQDTTNSEFEVAESLFGLTSESKIFFVEGYKANQYQLVFGNDVIGTSLKDGNIVTVTYRDVTSSDADGATNFTRSSAIDGYSEVTITANSASFGGSERETINSIKYNAPRFFQTQERAVIDDDFATIVKTNFPQIESVIAYGGELDTVPQYGKVIVSVKPYGSTGAISQSLKNQIKGILKLKSLTTEPIIKDPEYFYAEINSTVYYDNKLTTKSASTLKSEVITSIQAYDTSNLTAFGKDIRYSKVVTAVDATDSSIVSNDTSMRIIKRWSPLTNTETDQTISFSFDQSLDNKSETYAIESSTFPYITSANVTYPSAKLRDDDNGNISIVTIEDNETVVLKSSCGTVDYDTGEVQLNATFTSYDGSHISIYGLTKNKDIIASKNKFLIINIADVNVTVTQYLD